MWSRCHGGTWAGAQGSPAPSWAPTAVSKPTAPRYIHTFRKGPSLPDHTRAATAPMKVWHRWSDAWVGDGGCWGAGRPPSAALLGTEVHGQLPASCVVSGTMAVEVKEALTFPVE